MTKFFRENHCGCDDWTRQCTAAGFVNPGNACDSDGAELFLVTKSATPIHRQKLSADCADFHRFFLGSRNSPSENLRNLWMKSPRLLANGRRFLAFAPTEIIQFGPSRAAFRFDLNLCDARRIERE